jgi:hypothetical protein
VLCAYTAPVQDYWSTEKERVFLVGAAYKQQYQQQQQRQQREQRARSSATRPRSLFDLPRISSSSSGGSIGNRGGGLSPTAAAAVAAVGELAGGSGQRQRGSEQVSYSVDESIEELGRLAETAGLQVRVPSGLFLYSPGVTGACVGAFMT